jgi:hypothetical protein
MCLSQTWEAMKLISATLRHAISQWLPERAMPKCCRGNLLRQETEVPHDVIMERDHRERHVIYRINRRWNDFIRRPINHSALSAFTRKCLKIYLVVPHTPSWRDSSEEVSPLQTCLGLVFCRRRREAMLCLLSPSSQVKISWRFGGTYCLHFLSRSKLAAHFMLISCLVYSSPLKMEALSLSRGIPFCTVM